MINKYLFIEGRTTICKAVQRSIKSTKLVTSITIILCQHKFHLKIDDGTHPNEIGNDKEWYISGTGC